jgi:hypothetical protein
MDGFYAMLIVTALVLCAWGLFKIHRALLAINERLLVIANDFFVLYARLQGSEVKEVRND